MAEIQQVQEINELRVQVVYELNRRAYEQKNGIPSESDADVEKAVLAYRKERGNNRSSFDFREESCTEEIEERIITQLCTLPLFQKADNPEMYAIQAYFCKRVSYEVDVSSNSETLTLFEKNKATGATIETSYTFPFGMSLNLSLEAIKRTIGLESFSWQMKTRERNELREKAITAKANGLFITVPEEVYSESFRIVALENLIEILLDRGKRKTKSTPSMINDYLTPLFYVPARLSVTFVDIVNAIKILSVKKEADALAIHSMSDLVYHTLFLFPNLGSPRSPSLLRCCPLCGRLFFPVHNNSKYCLFRNPDCPGKRCKEANVEIAPKEESKKRTYERKVNRMSTNYSKRQGNGLTVDEICRNWGKEFQEALCDAKHTFERDPHYYTHMVAFLNDYEAKDDYPNKRKGKK